MTGQCVYEDEQKHCIPSLVAFISSLISSVRPLVVFRLSLTSSVRALVNLTSWPITFTLSSTFSVSTLVDSTFLSTWCVISKFRAAIIIFSSFVSMSNRKTASSTSFLPASFFRIFSVLYQQEGKVQ